MNAKYPVDRSENLSRLLEVRRAVGRHLFDFVPVVHSVIAVSVFQALYENLQAAYNHLQKLPAGYGLAVWASPSQWLVSGPYIDRALLSGFLILVWAGYFLAIAAFRVFSSDRYPLVLFVFDLLQAVALYSLGTALEIEGEAVLPIGYWPWFLCYLAVLGLIARLLLSIMRLSSPYAGHLGKDSLTYVRLLNGLVPAILQLSAFASVCFLGWMWRINEGDTTAAITAGLLGALHFNAIMLAFAAILWLLRQRSVRMEGSRIEEYMLQVWRRWKWVTLSAMGVAGTMVCAGVWFEPRLQPVALNVHGGFPPSVLLAGFAVFPPLAWKTLSLSGRLGKRTLGRLLRVPEDLPVMWHAFIDYWLEHFDFDGQAFLIHVHSRTGRARIVMKGGPRRPSGEERRRALDAALREVGRTDWSDQDGQPRVVRGLEGEFHYRALAPFFPARGNGKPNGLLIVLGEDPEARWLEEDAWSRNCARLCAWLSNVFALKWSRLRR